MSVQIFNKIKLALFPVFCSGCGEEGEWLCSKCFTALNFTGVWLCPVCHKPAAGGIRHDACVSSNLNGAISLFLYDDTHPVLDILKEFKYRLAYDTKSVWTKLWIGFYRERASMLKPLLNDSVIIPIPLHPRKARLRGFNQAEILAAALIEAIKIEGVKIKYRPEVLKRTRYTASQAELKNDHERRRENLFSAFAIRNNTRVSGRIILIDDVFTSGATLNAAAEALRNAGASQVISLTMFRG